MNSIVDLYAREKSVRDFLTALQENRYNYLVNSITPHHGYLLTYLSFLEGGDNVFYVASNPYKANLAYESFCKLAGYDDVNLYVADEIVAAELLAASSELKNERLSTIHSLLTEKKKIIVTHPQALLRPVFPKKRFREAMFALREGDEINLDNFVLKLIALGYKRVPTTSLVGEFSIRGEVIDISPLFSEAPFRLNLFDTVIEKIKVFDSETQRSIGSADEVLIFPLDEIFYGEEEKAEALKRIKDDAKEMPEFLKSDLADLENHNNPERLIKYINYFDENFTTILEYTETKKVFYEDYQRIKDNYEQLRIDLENYLEQISIPDGLNLFFFRLP